MAALTVTARTEGIVLDPIYTGRAMAGLFAAIEEGEVRAGQRTIFLHSGGMVSLFGHGATLAKLAETLAVSTPQTARPSTR